MQLSEKGFFNSIVHKLFIAVAHIFELLNLICLDLKDIVYSDY